MVSILINILVVINLIYTACIVILFSFNVVAKYRKFLKKKTFSESKTITTIVPLKNGSEQTLVNIKMLIASQPFENSRVIISVEDQNEPLFNELKLIERRENNFEVTIAGKLAGVNGKASNMLAAYNITDSEYVVFMDADVLVQKDNYCDMLLQFEDKNYGAVFSTAFYKHSKSMGGKMIRAVANYFFGEAVLLFESVIKINYCAGAFMAFRKTALDEAGGVKAVLNFISDDAALGNNVFNADYKIKILNTPVFMPGEKLNTWQSINHLAKWIVIVNKTMGKNYFFVPFSFYTGNIFLILILSVLTGEHLIFSLLLLIFASAFRLTSAALQDIMLTGRFAGYFDYAFTILAGYLQPFIWLSGFFLNKLSWAGKIYKIGKHGKILSVNEVK